MVETGGNESDEVVEVALTSEPQSEQRSRLMIAVGGVLLVAALLFGAYLASGDDDSQVDLTAPDDAEEAISDESDDPTEATTTGEVDDLDARDDTTEAVEVGDDEVERDLVNQGDSEFAASDSEVFGGGPNGVIFDGTQFIAIGWAESGQTLRTSTDGVTWDERRFPGLPANSNVFQLAEHEGTVIAIVEQWPEHNDEESDDIVERYFGFSEGPTHYVASSSDLENWTLTTLPDAKAGADGTRRFMNVSGVAIGAQGVVVMTQSYPEGPNEMRVLFDAGILDRDNLEQYCGINTEDDAAYLVQLCDFEENDALWRAFEEAMNEAGSDAERAQIERDFDALFVEPEPDVIATIEPGDPLYDELAVLFQDGGYEPTNAVLFGSPTGPFTSTDLFDAGYPVGVVEVEGTYVSIMQNWRDDQASTTTISSTDGRTWKTVGVLPSSNFGQLHVVGSNLLVLGGDESGSPQSLVSSDAGASWTPTTLTTALYGAYPQAASGPAGVAVVIQGATEPYPENFGAPEQLVIVKDGFTLTINYADDGGRLVLTDADGAVIYSLLEEEMYSGRNGIEGVVRMSRLSGTPTFLDPETGEDLVAFTSTDYEAAYEATAEDEPMEIDFGAEYWFSVDGLSWTTIDDPRLDIDTSSGNIQLVAVGDDEVIFAHHTWVEPPAALFVFEREGREPTSEEAQALDAWYSVNGGENAVEYIRIEIS